MHYFISLNQINLDSYLFGVPGTKLGAPTYSLVGLICQVLLTTWTLVCGSLNIAKKLQLHHAYHWPPQLPHLSISIEGYSKVKVGPSIGQPDIDRPLWSSRRHHPCTVMYFMVLRFPTCQQIFCRYIKIYCTHVVENAGLFQHWLDLGLASCRVACFHISLS